MTVSGRFVTQILGKIGGLLGGLLAIFIGLLLTIIYLYNPTETEMASAVVFVLLGSLSIYGVIIYTEKPMLAAKLLLSCGGLGFLILYELKFFIAGPYNPNYFNSNYIEIWWIWTFPGALIIVAGLIPWITADKSTFSLARPSNRILVPIFILVLIFGFSFLYDNYEKFFGPESETFCNFYALDKFPVHSNNSDQYNIRFRVEAKQNMRSFAITPINHSNNIEIIKFYQNLHNTRSIIAGEVIDPDIIIQGSGDSGWIQMEISFIDIDAHEKYILKKFELKSIQLRQHSSLPGLDFVQGIGGMCIALLLVYLFRTMKN